MTKEINILRQFEEIGIQLEGVNCHKDGQLSLFVADQKVGHAVGKALAWQPGHWIVITGRLWKEVPKEPLTGKELVLYRKASS